MRYNCSEISIRKPPQKKNLTMLVPATAPSLTGDSCTSTFLDDKQKGSTALHQRSVRSLPRLFFSFSGLLTFSKHATVTSAQRGGEQKSLPPSPWEWRDHVQHFWVDYALKDESSISVAPQSLLILFNDRPLFPKWGHCSCTVRHPFTTLGVFMIYNNLPAVGRLGVGGSTCVTTTRSVSA